MRGAQLRFEGPIRPDVPFDAELFRRVLDEKGYTQAAITETLDLGHSEGSFVRATDMHSILRKTAAPSEYHTLVRLFVLARTVPEDEASTALKPFPVSVLEALGLLEKAPEGVRSSVLLMPHEGMLIAFDFWPQITGEAMRDDFVLGIGPASMALGYLTVRREAGRTLDLGTGCGIQALMAARHSREVVATDINVRALNLAALNARLNGFSHVELREGSLFDPVRDDLFDLIVTNPPFVLSPGVTYQYRDSGIRGDGMIARVIKGASEHLREGGFCSMLFNWYHKDSDDWSERPRQLISGCGCDALLLCSETSDPISYATNWISRDTSVSPESYPRVLDQWLENFESLGIGRISFGALIFRRRTGTPNWFLMERLPDMTAQEACGSQIQRIFTARDIIGDGDDLLSRRLVLCADHELRHSLRAEDGIWKVQGAQIMQTKGLPFTGNVDRLMGTMLAGCDGKNTLGELVENLALGLHMEAEQIRTPCVDVMRMLMEKGFFEVV